MSGLGHNPSREKVAWFDKGLEQRGARFLNDLRFGAQHQSKGNGDEGREAELSRMLVGVPLRAQSGR